MRKDHADIVIVGAGPTGLTLAAELCRHGLSPLVLDKLSAGANTSRAAVIHARTLEVLEPLDVTWRLIENGLIVPIFRVRDRDRVLATVSFKDLKTAFPFTLMLPQDRTEAILLSRLEALGGSVVRPCEVVSVLQEKDDIQLQYKIGDQVQSVRASWVVGCDGSRSVVRQELGIGFLGETYEESFVLGDVQMDWPLDRSEVDLFFSEKGLVVIAPLPGDRFRIVATTEQKSSESPSAGDFHQILLERGPKSTPFHIRNVIWASCFRISHRIASAFRKGRVLLAGDAAHVHSPAGGQGMNTGIQDAVSLAAALQSALANGESTPVSEWAQQRFEVAREVISFTDRMTKMAALTSPLSRQLRDALVGLIGHVPLAERALAHRLAQLSN